jgi:ribosomal protein L31
MPCASNTKCIDLEPDYRSYLINSFTNQIKKLNYLASNRTKTYAIDTFILDYNHHQESNSDTLDGDDLFVYLDGYYCDCSDLNENLFRMTQNRDVTYAGQNCTLKLNACETLKHLCQHDSVCQSILSIRSTLNSTEQDIMCLCKPGYTGKYCQQQTSFRLDGTYSVKYNSNNLIQNSDFYASLYNSISPSTSKFNLKFDFRINKFDTNQMYAPLVYLEQIRNSSSMSKLANDRSSSLVFEILLHRKFLSVKNKYLDLEEKFAFYYVDTDANKHIWHSMELSVTSESNMQITYSCKELRLSITKTVILNKNLNSFLNVLPNSFTIGKFYASSLINDNNNGAINKAFLSGACIRDLTLNGEYFFNKEIYIDNKVITDSKRGIKYGCDHVTNQCLSPVTTSTTTGSLVSQSPFCLNNSTCVYKLFNHECVDCRMPFYGVNCQYGKGIIF